ncbi:MAG: hypothetical protein JO295_01480 [Verrucomicrobia bacterium]|nr:hypothetical protein [Verrucomicrobiota bacterium]
MNFPPPSRRHRHRRAIRWRVELLLPLLLAFVCGAALRSSLGASADDTARFLAGLPVSAGSDLAPLTSSPAWTAHAAYFNRAWLKLETRQIVPARTWAATNFPNFTQSSAPLFYMFSGPDILYADTLFPNARTVVLCGLEPVGDVPDLARLQPGEIAGALQNLQTTLNSVLSFSFFITKDMRRDFAGGVLKGNLPAIYVLLARLGHPLLKVEPVALDRSGALSAGGPTRGVRIVYGAADGGSRTLYYFTTDLSDDGIKSNPGFIKFCAGLGTGHSLLKAASYLMHQNGFNRVREFLLDHSAAILQDDSGVPLRYFAPDKWVVRTAGAYRGPIELFKQHYQADLAQLYQQSQPIPLTFGFGYQWSSSRSTVLLAVRDSSGGEQRRVVAPPPQQQAPQTQPPAPVREPAPPEVRRAAPVAPPPPPPAEPPPSTQPRVERALPVGP